MADIVKKSDLLGLPTELLEYILRNVICKRINELWFQPDDKDIMNSSALACSLVCAQITSIAQPLLYETVIFYGTYGYKASPPDGIVAAFLRTMQSTPRLQPACKRLAFDMQDRNDDDELSETSIHMVMELLPLLTGLKSLHVRGGFDSYGFQTGLFNATAHMAHLTEIKFDRWWYDGPALRSLCANPLPLRIKTVILRGCDYEGDIGESLLDMITIHGAERQMAIESLKLEEFSDTPEHLFQFLHLPKALKCFSLSNIHFWTSESLWTPAHIESALSIQQESLEKVVIGDIFQNSVDTSQGFVDVINFAALTNLKELDISASNFSLSPETAGMKYLGPQLRSITFDCRARDRSRRVFGSKEAKWMIRFGQYAAEHKRPLRCVRMVYHPHEFYEKEINEPAYVLGQLGIDLSYKPPASV